jgi:ribose transport system permease protein
MTASLPSRAVLQGLIVYAGFVLIFVFFSVMLWDRGFLTTTNLSNIVLQTAPAGPVPRAGGRLQVVVEI